MANIASALAESPHLTAFSQAVAAELAQTSFAPLLMYVIDEAPEAALYHLADQFNVLGWKGWRLATTETQRRELIKNAIRLQRVKGTPFAIKEAVKTLGFERAEIRENIGITYDGDQQYNGAITYGTGGGVFTFRVLIFVGTETAINAALIADVTELVLAYKNARSHLVDVSFALTLQDTLAPSETLEYDGNEVVDSLTPGVTYNGAASYGGEQTHNKGASSLNLRIYRNGILTENGTY